MTTFATIAVLGLGAGMAFGELPKVKIEAFSTGYDSPVEMVPYGDGFLVVDQSGVISVLGADGGKPTGVFLDMRNKIVELRPGFDERGLLGIAFHPKFAENGKVYVYYSAKLQEGAPEGWDHTGYVSEFSVKADKSAVDPSTERVVLKIDQPQWNHNGGLLEFGPDGMLYLAFGDGGKANDEGLGHPKGGNGQFMDTFLGKVLRIDVDGGKPYGIPKDNPFVGKEGRDEIYALGIRNPWGICFDENGDLLLADVGQNRYEEVNIIKKGGNYGWPQWEGVWPFTSKGAGDTPKGKPPVMPSKFEAPILVYPHNEAYGKAPGYGISITGGFVYRGKALKGLQGTYLFADWTVSWATRKMGLYAGVKGADGKWTMQVVPGQKAPEGKDQRVIGFGYDKAGEPFVLTNTTGKPTAGGGGIFKIVPAE